MEPVDQIAPLALEAWGADAGATPVLLDVREPWECAVARVAPAAGYALAAIPMQQVPARLAELDPDVPVACLCHHGARSQRVAQFLAANGFAHVANVAGGIDAWSRERDQDVPRY